MNVLYTCDNNYVWLMAISTISLFETNKKNSNLDVYLLGENISDVNKQILYDIAKQYGRKIIIIDIENINIPDKLVSTRWPTSAFSRLFACDFLPKDLNKILYLDCDTIINGDISRLEGIEFNDNYVIGVKDCINQRYKRNIGLSINDNYINAGVILMNLKGIREINIKEKIDYFLETFGNMISFADQDILNGIFKSKIDILSPEYNTMTVISEYDYKDIIRLRRPSTYYNKDEINNSKENALIIHYTTNMKTIRPWFSNSNHPEKEIFTKFLSTSPFKNKEMPNYLFNTKESKIIGYIQIFPKIISFNLLGFIHSYLKPNYVFIKNKFKKKERVL